MALFQKLENDNVIQRQNAIWEKYPEVKTSKCLKEVRPLLILCHQLHPKTLWHFYFRIHSFDKYHKDMVEQNHEIFRSRILHLQPNTEITDIPILTEQMKLELKCMEHFRIKIDDIKCFLKTEIKSSSHGRRICNQRDGHSCRISLFARSLTF